MKKIVVAVSICLALAACGSSLSGTYLPQGGGMGNGLVMEKMVFGSGDSVTLTMMQQNVRVQYKVDGKQLLLTLNGQSLVFDIDNKGCLDGGGLYGKFCKA
jgi:hypothetical protein